MILYITDKEVDDSNVQTLNVAKLAVKAYHPFIATTEWEMVKVDIQENTPKGILKQMTPFVKIVPVFNKDDVHPKELTLILELLGSEGLELYALYTKDKKLFQEKLNSICEQKGW